MVRDAGSVHRGGVLVWGDTPAGRQPASDDDVRARTASFLRIRSLVASVSRWACYELGLLSKSDGCVPIFLF